MKLILISLFLAVTIRADIVLYDEPQDAQTGGYILVMQRKGPDLAAMGSSIETCAFPKDTNGNSNCFSGLACIEGTNTRDLYQQGSKFGIRFPNFGWIYFSEFTSVSYWIRLKALASAGRMNIHAFTGVTSQTDVKDIGGKIATVGYDASTMWGLSYKNYGPNATWQKITVPTSAWNFNGPINRLTWDMVGSTLNQWDIDLIVLEGTGTIHYPNPYPPVGQ